MGMIQTIRSAPLAPAPEMADIFAALGDPIRLCILSILAWMPEMVTVDALRDRVNGGLALALGQPTISYHLRILRQARLVRIERKHCCFVYYGIVPETFEQVRLFLSTLNRGQ